MRWIKHEVYGGAVQFMRCGLCWRVIDAEADRYWDKDAECPGCGKVHGTYLIWPNVNARNFRRIAYEQDLMEGDGRMIALIFTITAIESILYELLEGLMLPDEKNRTKVVETLREKWRFGDRKKLFKEMRGRSIKDTMVECGYRHFYDDWLALDAARDALIHGDTFFEGMTKPLLPIKEVMDNAPQVFRAVNNDVCAFLDDKRR